MYQYILKRTRVSFVTITSMNQEIRTIGITGTTGAMEVK